MKLSDTPPPNSDTLTPEPDRYREGTIEGYPCVFDLQAKAYTPIPAGFVVVTEQEQVTAIKNPRGADARLLWVPVSPTAQTSIDLHLAPGLEEADQNVTKDAQLNREMWKATASGRRHLFATALRETNRDEMDALMSLLDFKSREDMARWIKECQRNATWKRQQKTESES